jgi:hypothetical protein
LRKQCAHRTQFTDAFAHLSNTFGEVAMLGHCVTAKDLAERTDHSEALLPAIVDHSLTDVAHGIWFAAQLMQDARGPQCDANGERMREHFREREPFAAPRQRLLRVAELT